MLEFREQIQALMNEKQMKSANLAEALDLQKSVIHRFLSGSKLEFYNALRVARYLDPINYLTIMDEYCLTLDVKISILCAFEYASNFSRTELTKALIEKHSDRKGDIADYVKVYSTFLVRREMSDRELLEFAKENYGKTSSLELKAKILLIEAGMYFDKMKFNIVHTLLDVIESKVNQITNRFVQESFLVRLALFGANAELKAQGNPEKTREYCDVLINSYATPEVVVASAYHTLGHAYMFENMEESILNFKRASKLYKAAGYLENSKAVLVQDVCFTRNIHNVEFDLNETEGDELAHQYIVRGENDKALEVLVSLEETPYVLLYKGIAGKDFPLILKAHGIMMKAGENFFIKLFERELYQLYNHKGVDHYEKSR